MKKALRKGLATILTLSMVLTMTLTSGVVLAANEGGGEYLPVPVADDDTADSNVYYDTDDVYEDPSLYVALDGEWHHKLYRTYPNMYQYFPYVGVKITWEDLEAAVLPSAGTWKTWDAVQMPYDNPETGGLLSQELAPTWSESWVCREFDLPEDFASGDTVTLLMGVIDDNDVVYINGQAVAASGFVDGNGKAIIDVPATGGFVYDRATPAEDQVKWSKSYWEIQREYVIPTDVLNQGGTNEICVRLYNNNSDGGFYTNGNIYAICGNDMAVRAIKGLPTEKAESPAVEAAVATQIAALESGDANAYADTISDNYHNDADVKADKVAEIEALVGAYSEITVADTDVAIYLDDEGNYWYSAVRAITGDGETISSETIEVCYEVSGGTAQERGNWNRCYGTSYRSELFGEDLTYSVYLPPSYYENSDQEYPVVWLLHGRASSSTSYRNVDNIGAFMDDQINSGKIVEMVVIMPDSGKYAFYQDSELTPGDKDNSGPWRTQLTTELRGEVQENYRVLTDAKFNGLTGNSMGGYGAMCVGTSYPDLYSSVGVHMGYLPSAALDSLKSLSMDQLRAYDFYLDCGLQDGTVGTSGTIAVHDYLEKVNKTHGYDLRNGGHNSAFYMSGMPASMKMHSDHFLANGLLEEDAPDTGSTGSGGSSVTKYSITVDEMENGAVTVSPERAAKGKEVTLTVVPDAGYELGSLVVKDAKGKEIEVTEENGKYTFVMPNSKLSVEAEFVLADADETCPAKKFDDLDTDAWYHKAVDYVLNENMMAGMSKDTFAPNGTLTRAMVVQILWAMEGKPVVNYAMSFGDVAADSWYAEAVRWAASEGIVSGYSDTAFGSNDSVTREQLAAMLWKYAQNRNADVSVGENTNILSYQDAAEISEYAIPAIQWACGAGVMSGKTGGYLDPTGTATRAEAAQMLMKFCAVVEG